MTAHGVLAGCGFFADNHLHSWRDLGVIIEAVCDLDPGRAEAAAKRHGIGKVYTDADLMLRECRPDFIDIAAPVSAHRRLVEAAARHKVAAICQKPFATSLADADAMVAACEEAGVHLMVHENFRWQTPMLAVQRVARSGAIGEPFFGRISFRHDYDVYRVQPYLAEDERFAIMDVGVHLLDLARFFFGDVTSLSCVTQRVNPRVKGEDVFTMLLTHEGGASSIVDASFYTHAQPNPFPQTTVEMDGTRGSLKLAAGYDLTVTAGDVTEVTRVQPEAAPWMEPPFHVVQESVRNLQRHWLDVLAGRARPATSGADNRRTLELVLAGYQAAETRRTLTFGPPEGAGLL